MSDRKLLILFTSFLAMQHGITPEVGTCDRVYEGLSL